MGGRRWRRAGVVLVGLFVPLLSRVSVPAAAQPVTSSPGPALPASRGYWAVGAGGGVLGTGGAGFYGSTGAVRLNRPIVGMAPSRSGRGYWLVASDGGVFAFGDAVFRGSTGAIRLNRPIVGMAATPSGAGYWLVASDGGVFAFGDAVFRGSTGAIRLNHPVAAIAATPSGAGYWLAAADGGVFAFGDAVFRGSTGGLRLARPVAGLASTPSGRGYWLAAADGGVFAFGDAPFLGSPVASGEPRSVVGMAATHRGLGYWLASADGAVDAFGDAVVAGNSVGSRGAPAVVGIAAAPVRTTPETAAFFYPWYARPDLDFVWRHWEANRHSPPDDVAANFYPSRGAYSSSDPAVLDAQMAELAAAGVDAVISSWWGRGSFEDDVLPAVAAAASARGVRLAVHLEPYPGRTVERVVEDVAYLRRFGVGDVWVYEAALSPATAWAAARGRLGDVRLMAETGNLASVRSGAFVEFARTGRFDGVYSYDAVRYTAADFANLCGLARQERLLCSPSVAPGYVATRTKPADLRVLDRAGGTRYDTQWRAALAAGADIVSITSYNEWHEGTQIEPARPYCFPDAFCSPGYEGAYGTSGAGAETSYLGRTRVWTDAFRAS